MKKIFILGFVLLPLLSVSAQDWPSGGAMHEGMSQNEKRSAKAKTAEMLVNKIDEKLKDIKYVAYREGSLQKQHKAWLDYVDETCMMTGIMTGAGGSWPSTYALKCENNMLDQRLFKLSNSLQCVKRHIKNKQEMYIANCLYQGFSINY